MSPHETLESDPAFRALRSRVDRLERATATEQRLTELERLVRALAAETTRQQAVLEELLDEDDSRLEREPALDALRTDLASNATAKTDDDGCVSEPPQPRDSPPDDE
ncbi:MAG: hypothetical protein U5K28_01755 [Halobacteriales archaeon]|nr:hypothetical protein [Halobacteriales archaeon]